MYIYIYICIYIYILYDFDIFFDILSVFYENYE